MLDLAILNAEAAAEMYKKPIAELARNLHYDPLPHDVRTIVIQSWRNFGVLTPEIIERMVPALPEHANTAGAA